jgi:hypothetical protein
MLILAGADGGIFKNFLLVPRKIDLILNSKMMQGVRENRAIKLMPCTFKAASVKRSAQIY